MRKIALLAIASLSLAATAVAAPATGDSVTYKVSINPNKARTKPVNGSYTATLTVSGAGGTQPHGVTETDVFFAKQFLNNGRKFPSPCKQSDIDGKTSVPSKCKKAVIGSGTATATAGPAGSKPLGSETFSVTIYNANRGKSVFLVLNGTSPVPVHNRVIVGTIKRLRHGPFGYETVFVIPASAQTVPGTSIQSVITQSTLKIGKTRKGVGYGQLLACPKSHKLPAKVVLHFNNGTTGTGTASITCRRGR